MLRITEKDEAGKMVRLRLDGTLNPPEYGELENVCARHEHRAGTTILLDMGGVVFIHEEVARRLVERQSERVRLINCSPFVESLLQTLADERESQS